MLRGIEDDWAGRLRHEHERVGIGGAKHQPPDGEYVPGMVDRMFERLREASDVDPIKLAMWAHWTIARIHLQVWACKKRNGGRIDAARFLPRGARGA